MSFAAGLVTAIVGLAALNIVLRKESNTTGVIKESFSGFNQVLGTAMGSGKLG